MMASLIIGLQRHEESSGTAVSEPVAWREAKAGEIRKIAAAAFAAIGAPFEYPTLPQMRKVKAEMERRLGWDRLDGALRGAHEQTCLSLFSKFEEPF